MSAARDGGGKRFPEGNAARGLPMSEPAAAQDGRRPAEHEPVNFAVSGVRQKHRAMQEGGVEISEQSRRKPAQKRAGRTRLRAVDFREPREVSSAAGTYSPPIVAATDFAPVDNSRLRCLALDVGIVSHDINGHPWHKLGRQSPFGCRPLRK